MKRYPVILLALLALCFALSAQQISVRPVIDLDKGFIMGADVSMLAQIESLGGKYYDERGKAGDCLAILKSNGVNWIRLRIWNDPVNREDVRDNGRVLSKAGDKVGGGNDDLAAYIRIAKRAKKLGLKVAADFHYSDFWADPSKQVTPYAWKDLDLGGLKKALYDYTRASLAAMRAAGAAPDLVQVGNEVDDGFLWPIGKLYPASADEVVGGQEAFTALLKEAVRAVRDEDPARANPAKRIKVMVHISSGGDNAHFRKFFDPLVAAGLDFDVIGISFYPYWHGKLADLSANISDLATRYGKGLIVAETSYAWTLENADGLGNSFGPGSDRLGGYKATVQGQATAIADIIAAVADAPKSEGLGVFYWEPDWIPVEGAGWRTGDGSSWENQALFDFQGKALPSLKVWKLVAGKGEFPDLAIVSVESVKAKLAAGTKLELPKSTLAAFSDDSLRPVQVKWDMPDPSALASVGTVEIKGSVLGYGNPVTATVDVVVDVNLIKDASFESGHLASEWSLTGPGLKAAAPVEKNPGNAHSGDYSFKYWLDKPFQFTLSRTFTDLKDGSYTLRVWAMGGGGEKDYYLFARNYATRSGEGSGPDLSAKIVNTGWQKWKLYEIKGIPVVGGSCEIGLSMDGDSGNWGNADDFEFTRDPDQ